MALQSPRDLWGWATVSPLSFERHQMQAWDRIVAVVRTSISELLKGLNAASKSARNGFMGQGLKAPGRQLFG